MVLENHSLHLPSKCLAAHGLMIILHEIVVLCLFVFVALRPMSTAMVLRDGQFT